MMTSGATTGKKVVRAYRLLQESRENGHLTVPVNSYLRREFESEAHAAEAIKDFSPIGASYVVIEVLKLVETA